MAAYYNEIDAYAAQWLRNLIAAGHIAPGDVDERSIVDVRPDDLKGYVQCHFFAGIGGWSYAARLAGWPDDRALWTGSCPCQPYSVAGQGKGQADDRDLWPAFFALIAGARPSVVMGEQVAAAVGKHWLDRVHVDLEGVGYAVGAAVVPACAVDAPHRRDRLWFVADAAHKCLDRSGQAGAARRDEPANGRGAVADTNLSGEGQGREQRSGQLRWLGGDQGARSVGDANLSREDAHAAASPSWRAAGKPSQWAFAERMDGRDGKARRVEPSIRLLAHGVPARVGKLRAYGNAIVPQVAAEVIGAYLDVMEAA